MPAAESDPLNATAPVGDDGARKAAEKAAEELERINAELMESTKQEVAAKEARITELQDLVEELEQKLREAPEPHSAERPLASIESEKELWLKERGEMEQHVVDLRSAIEQREAKIEELEGVRDAIKENYEFRLEEKEQALEKSVKESELYAAELQGQIENLKKAIAEAKVSGSSKAAEQAKDYEDRIKKLTEDGAKKLQAKMDEINELQAAKAALEVDFSKKLREIETLQGQVQDLQNAEIQLKKRMEKLAEQAGNAEELGDQVKELTKENSKMKKELMGVSDKFREEMNKRKALLNELEDMKGKIRVYCRIRPFSRTEKEDESKAKYCFEIPDAMSVTIHGRIEHHYNFDSVFGPDSTQDQIFDETKRLVQSAIDGYNVCIFAYGQTGSGKTFTI